MRNIDAYTISARCRQSFERYLTPPARDSAHHVHRRILFVLAQEGSIVYSAVMAQVDEGGGDESFLCDFLTAITKVCTWLAVLQNKVLTHGHTSAS